MADYVADEHKMVLKIVYYGPALSGKTTNLMGLHDLIAPVSCGDLMSFETKGDRTLFFDLLPIWVASEHSKLRIKIKLYTVPGQVAHDATRKAVLSRSDGIVFVADSQVNQAVSNFESFDNLEKNASRVGLDLSDLPLVIQFNKRDLKDIISREDILKRWTPSGVPLTFGSALHRKGVMETFSELLTQVYAKLDLDYDLVNTHGLSLKDFLDVVAGEMGNEIR